MKRVPSPILHPMIPVPADNAELPQLQVSRWFNAPADFSLAHLRGRVVILHTFQMLCPGCVLHAFPQLNRLAALQLPDLAIVGLHTVFEHHAVMNERALEVFLHEYRIDHPIGVDAYAPGESAPKTMRALALRGTPSLVLIDRQGRLRDQHFGAVDDLMLGCLIGSLLAEPAPQPL